MEISSYNSKLGAITIASENGYLVGLWFDGQIHDRSTLSGKVEFQKSKIIETTIEWLDIYFSGKVPDFMPQLKIEMTLFANYVYNILCTIPYGKTITYGDIAKMIAQKTDRKIVSPQAVGNAVGRNPISIIIPCHRVVGANGKLTGYAGGIERKEWLLNFEQKQLVL